VTLAFRSELASFAALDRALRVAACPWFGVDLDPVAMLRDRWSQEEVFSKMATQIRNVRARDALLGSENRTKSTAIGLGSVDWPGLLKNLNDSGYQNWITIDPLDLPNRQNALIAGQSFLRNIRN
jgi:sugar phosphate isomerase/epimerase